MSFSNRGLVYIVFASVAFVANLSHINIAAQEKSGARDLLSEEKNSNEIEVRKLFVPEEAASIVLGELKNADQQYLPIDINSIEKLLTSGKSPSQSSFEQAEFDLRLSGKNLLVGTGSFLVAESSEATSIEFRSDVWLDDPTSMSKFDMPPQVGRRADGVQVFQSVTGGRFTSNVTALLEPSTGFTTIQFPRSTRGVKVRLSVPESLRVISRQSIGELNLCLDQGEGVGYRHYLIETPDGRVDLRLRNSTKKSRIVAVDADLQFDASSAMIRFQTKLDSMENLRESLRVNLPIGFVCSRILINGKSVSFQPSVESGKTTALSNQLSIDTRGLADSAVSLTVQCYKKMRKKNVFVLGTFSVVGYDVGQFRLSLSKVSIWNYERIIPEGFFVEESLGDRLLFSRINPESMVILEVVRRKEELKSNRVSVSAVNGTIRTSQVISGVPRNGILKLNDGWEVQSIVDVWQDEFPLPINRRVTADGPVLILSNEEDVIRIVAEKKIDPRNVYATRDFLVIPNIQADSPFEFLNGFSEAKSVRIVASSGLPDETKLNGQLESDFESVEDVRFLFSAESSLVSDELEFNIVIDVHEDVVTTTYTAKHPNQPNGRPIIIGVDGIENWKTKRLGQKVGRVMSDVEMRLLGLESDRRFWMLPKPNVGGEKSQIVAQSVQRFGNETTLNVQLPYSVLNMVPSGKIRFVSDDPRIQFDLDDLEEIPNDLQTDRSRQFVMTGAVPRLVIHRVMDGEVRESISAISKRLFIRSNGTKHDRIECVFVEGISESAKLPQSDSPNVSGSREALGAKDWCCFSIASDQPFSDAWLSIDGTVFRGYQFENEWRFKVPRPILAKSGKSQLFLNLNHADHSGWLVSHGHGQLLFDGESVELSYESIEVSPNFMGIQSGFGFSPSLRESVKSVLWLPLQICDTATARDLFGSDHAAVSEFSPEDQVNFFIRREIVVSVGVCLFFLAVAYGVMTRRLRWVLIFALISITSGTVLSGIPALLCCFFFWGFSFGAVVRELRQLSTFRRFVPFGVLVFAVLPLELNGQESGVTKTKSKQTAREKQIRYIVYPVDKDKKTLGIGYLPRDLYELANRNSISQPRLFHSSEVRIGVARNEAEMQLSFSFDLTSFDGQITLPYLFDSAVYLEDSISVNGRQVDFIPDIKKQSVQISLPNGGRQTISVRLFAPLPFKSTRIQLPAPGLIQLVNDSPFKLVADVIAEGSDSTIQSPKNATLTKSLPIGQKTFLMQNRTLQLSMPEKLPSISILETDEFSKNLVKKRVLLVNNELPIKEIQVSIPDGFRLDNTEDENLFVDQAPNQITILELGKSQEIVFVKQVNSFGTRKFRPIVVRNVEIQTHLLSAIEGQGVAIGSYSGRDSLVDSQTPFQLQLNAKWRAIEDSIDSKREAARSPAIIFDATSELPTAKVFETETSITGSSIQQHFLSNSSHRIDAEFNISFSKTLDSFSITLPDGFEIPTVELGGASLPIYRVSANQFFVVTKELQAGAYRFVVGTKRKVAALDRKIKSIEVRSANVITTHQIWLDRGFKLKPSSPLIQPLSRQIEGRYLFAGTLGFDEGEVELTRNNQSAKDVVSIEDEIRFKNGRVLHRVQIELNSKVAFGARIGMEVPFDAANIQVLTKSWEGIVERSESFGVQHLWISPDLSPSKQVFITFDSGLSGKGVGLPSLIGQAMLTKSVIVPRRFSDDELNWNMSEAKSNGETLICSLPSSKEFLSYKIEKRVEPAPSVDFVEHVYNVEESILTSRFYLSPNGANSICVQIPSGQFLRSVKLAGRSRNVSRISKEEYRIDLFDQRICQTLELFSRIPEVGSKRQSIHLPQPIDWPVGLSFFQSIGDGKKLALTNLSAATFSDLDAARKKHFMRAVEIFELNRSTLNDQLWRSTLLDLSKVANVDFETNELPTKPRVKGVLSKSISSQNDDSLQVGFAEVVSAGKPIWYLIEPGAVIQLATSVHHSNFYWAMIVIALTIGVGGSGLVFQRFFPSLVQPLFSFSLIISLWLFSVAWIIMTPQSIFAWCSIILAFCLAVLLIINSVEYVRIRRHQRRTNEA